MARPVVYHWKASDTSAVCKLQSTAGAASLILDGNEVSAGIAQFPGVQRTVSITSINNLTGVNFTINGTLDNRTVSVTRAGPNGTGVPVTVYTSQLFTTVTSVTVDVAANAVSLGSGILGQTNWFAFNFQQTFPAMTVSVTDVVGTVNLIGTTTLSDVNDGKYPLGPRDDVFEGIIGLDTQFHVDKFGTCMIPVRSANILVVTGTTGSFTATFLQQGIT